MKLTKAQYNLLQYYKDDLANNDTLTIFDHYDDFEEFKSIDDGNFYSGNDLIALRLLVLKSIGLEETIQDWDHIPEDAFYRLECKELKNFVVPSKVQSIGHQAFAKSKIKRLDFSHNTMITELPNSVAEASYIEEIIWSSSIEKIGQCSFEGCLIKKLDIPATVKSLDYATFRDCRALEEVIIRGKDCGFDATTFAGCSNLKVLKCYKDSTANIVFKQMRKYDPSIIVEYLN